MHVELWSRTGEGVSPIKDGIPRVIGIVHGDGRIEEQGKEIVVPIIREEIADQKKRVPENEAFLQSLPREFSGSYLWARLKRTTLKPSA